MCFISQNFFVLGDGWILLAIRFKDKNLVCIRFVSYFHQLHETFNELVHSPYSFKNTLRRVSDQSSFITGGGRGGNRRILVVPNPPQGAVVFEGFPLLAIDDP